ncbi:MAG TPA: hypothetical protein VF980_02505 [Thermoanaerobaculia bacterium]
MFAIGFSSLDFFAVAVEALVCAADCVCVVAAVVLVVLVVAVVSLWVEVLFCASCAQPNSMTINAA